MSNILKGIINEAHYPEDPDEYEAMFGARRKSKRMEPNEPQEPYNPMDDYYRKQDAAQAKYDKEVNVKYIDKEGVASNGKKYNNILYIQSRDPYQIDNEVRKFKDLHWGAKTIVDLDKKEPEEKNKPYIGILYFVDNHKYGYWKPWKNEAPTQKPLTFENPVEQFGQVLEGISQEDLANTLCHRIEMRYPDIYKKYDYDKMYAAVDDVASFHAGAEELGSSDINMMIRQVFKRLEESEGLDEGIARGPKEKALYQLLEAWLYFISLKATKIAARDAIDTNGQQILASMQRHYLGPVVNGMTMGEILQGDLWQNSKVIPHLLKYIYQGIPYIEERIKKFVKPSEQQNYLSAIEKIKQLYKESVTQYSQGVAEDQLDELKCWDGYKRVPGTKAGDPGSCKEIEERELNEYSTDRLAKYKTSAAADARAADKAGNFARGNKRFAGIVKATKKQFDNETKPKKESAIMKGLVDENLGTPYPGTYEQEFGPFKRKGSERTMKLTTEGKKNVSRRT